MVDIKTQLGARIKELRKARNITQEKLVERRIHQITKIQNKNPKHKS